MHSRFSLAYRVLQYFSTCETPHFEFICVSVQLTMVYKHGDNRWGPVRSFIVMSLTCAIFFACLCICYMLRFLRIAIFNLSTVIYLLLTIHIIHFCNIKYFYVLSCNIYRARGSVVGWVTMLQAGRSRVRIPMRSLDFSINTTSL
jgi:hypothetical protein